MGKGLSAYFSSVLFFSVHWKQMTTSPVCFGASADSFGRFVTPIAGHLLKFKLIHQSGSVECAAGSSSHWGCTYPEMPQDHRLGTIITNPRVYDFFQKITIFSKESLVTITFMAFQVKPLTHQSCCLITFSLL